MSDRAILFLGEKIVSCSPRLPIIIAVVLASNFLQRADNSIQLINRYLKPA